MEGWTDLFLARLQMALTLGLHIIPACLGVGFPVLVLAAEWKYLHSGDELWRLLAQRWAKAFAVLFALGAVSGTVLSFELGILWPKFLGTWGPVIGMPFTLEGFAFFIEAIFAGIYIYGWRRLSPWAHWWSGVPIAVGGLLSAFFVVMANSWMNCPRGFTLQDGVVVNANVWEAMFNPATPAQTTHMIVAAYMSTGFLIGSYYAWLSLRGDGTTYTRRAMTLAVVMGCLMAPLQTAVGHWTGQMVAKTQPVKLAALEGQFQTQTWAPLRIGGWPDESQRRTHYALEIPGGLSWLAYGNPEAKVTGLDDFPKELNPPVLVVHLAFQAMVTIGILLLGLSIGLAATWGIRRLRGQEPRVGKILLISLIAAGPLAVLAVETGWVVTEVGRQPWIVQGYMKTAQAVTTAPGMAWVFLITVGIYAVLTAGCVVVLAHLAQQPLGLKNQGESEYGQ